MTTTTNVAPPPPPPPPATPIRSQGRVTVGYIQNGLQDLDRQPPSTTEPDGHGDVWFSSAGTSGNTLFAIDGAKIGSWDGPASTPTYDECRYTAGSGVGEHALRSGDVLCVKTNEGRTALLVVKVLTEPAKTGHLPTFETTVWEPITR